jgi:hypothetical protein
MVAIDNQLYLILFDIVWYQRISSSIIYSIKYNCISFLNCFPDAERVANDIAEVKDNLLKAKALQAVNVNHR